MALADFVNVQISSTGPAATQPGFGEPLILAADAPVGFNNRVREYGSLTDLTGDNFSPTDPTYLQAAKVLAQTPRPPKFKVGRLVNIPQQQWLLTPVAFDSTVYNVYVDGQKATFTSGVGATIHQISSGLKTAIDALSLAVAVGVPTNWAQSTPYVSGNQVITAAGNVFECTANGTSSNSGTGPTGTLGQTGISDGTVTWKCIATGVAGAQFLLTVSATGKGAGNYHTIYVTDQTGSTAIGTTLLGVKDTTVDPGTAADLAAILAEDTNWYALLGQFNSSAILTAKAVFAEANKKLNMSETQDSEVVNHAASGATDVAATLQTSNYFYTSLWYSPSNGDFLEAAIAGLKLTTNPGSEIWGLSTVAGVPTTNLKPTQRTSALAKNANVYEKVAGVGVTELGKVSSGEWIDIVRFKDWLTAIIEADVFAFLTSVAATNQKVPYTDDGIQAIKSVILADLKKGIAAGGLARNPAPAVSVPLAANVSSTDKQNRTLTTVTFTGTLAGAIIAVTPINGTLTF